MSEFVHRFRRLLREAFSPEPGGRFDVVAFGILLVFAAAAPLNYGGVLPGGQLAIELAAFLVAAGAFLARRRTPRIGAGWIPIGALLGLVTLGALQLLPLPDGLLSTVSPTSQKIYHEAGEILSVFPPPAELRARISVAPVETAGTVRLTLAYGALFFAAARLLQSRARRRVFSGVLLFAGLLYVGVGAALHADRTRLHGPFVNPNHFAAYLEIVLSVAFACLWSEVLVNAERGQGLADRASRIEKRIFPLAWRTLAWIVVAGGLALTQSRAGIVTAVVVTLTAVAVGLSHHRARVGKRRLLAGILVGLGAVAGVVAISRGPALGRFLGSDPRDLQGGIRADLWRISLDAWREFPVFGDGLGAFREAFRRVQPREFNGLVEQAHSDPLQLLVTGGVVGLVLGAVLYGSLFVVLFSRWRAQRHREETAVILGAMAALLAIALHGLVDFPMSIPAIPALLACVLGMAWAAGDTSPGSKP